MQSIPASNLSRLMIKCLFAYSYMINTQEGIMQQFDAAKVLLLLRQTQSQHTQTIEKQLLSYSKHPQFVQFMHALLCSDIEQILKTMTAVLLNRALCQSQNTTPEQLQAKLADILLDTNIKNRKKHSFQKSIIISIERSSATVQRQWKNLAITMLKKDSLIDPALLLITCFSLCNVDKQQLCSFLSDTFELSFSLQVKMVNHELLKQMVKTWIIVFDRLRQLESSYTQVSEVLALISISWKVLHSIQQIYQLAAPNEIWFSLGKEAPELHSLKYEAAEFHKRILLYTKDHTQLPKCAFQRLKNSSNVLTRSLVFAAKNKNILNRLQCQQFVTSLFSLYQILFTICPLKNNIELMSLLNLVVFPLLQMNEEEQIMFEDVSEEFLSLHEDCADQQQFYVLKTEAAKLLEFICDQYEPMLQFIINKCVQSLIVHQKLSQVEYPDPLPFETSLLILSVLSYKLADYPQHLAWMHKIFANRNIISTLSHQELSRVFIFMGYNYSEIFENASQGEHWFFCALEAHQHPTVLYCALDFLRSLFEEYFTEHLVRQFTDKCVQNSKLVIVWEICERMLLTKYSRFTTQSLSYLTTGIIHRIEQQFTQISNKSSKNTQDNLNVIKAIHVLVYIMVHINNDNNGQKCHLIRQTIWTCTKHFQSAAKLNIEDEIVKLIMVYCRNTITDEIYSILPELMQQFLRNGHHQRCYLKLFNHLIMQSTHKCVFELIRLLINSLLALVTHKRRDGQQYQRTLIVPAKKSSCIALSSILILLQNALITHNSTLSKDFILQLSSICLSILPPCDKSINRIVHARCLNLLVICNITTPSVNILELLYDVQGKDIYHGYDTKVLVALMCQELAKETHPNIFREILVFLISVIYASDEKDIELKEAKKKTVKQSPVSTVKLMEDYDRILKNLKTPFADIKQPRQRLKDLLKALHSNDLQVYIEIVSKLDEPVRQKLFQFMAVQTVVNHQRIIWKVVAPKLVSAEVYDSMSGKRIMGMEYQQDENRDCEIQVYKRQRKIHKKRHKSEDAFVMKLG